MINNSLLQILTGMAGSFGFSVLYNVRGTKLIWASLGGGLSYTLYLLLASAFPSEMLRYFISAAFVAVYAEILARLLRTPATTFLIPSIIPHIPGGALYRTMQYALNRQWRACMGQAIYTVSLALGLALGIIAVLSVFSVANVVMNRLWYHRANKRST